MPKKSGVILISLGAVLILAALLLFLYNRSEDRRAGQEAESLLEDVRSAMAANADPEPQEEPAEEITYDYAGVIAIPDLSLELPVIDQWNYARLKVAPCRQSGAAADGDLVIAAHNYKSHFGYLDRLEPGASVIFTDMEGTVYRYAVEEIRQLEPEDVEDVSSVFSSEYPLVLYTCTPGGKARVAVFCRWAETTE
ncbi:MAG: sortase [Vescimonas sp.]